jgi:hypothetical protein
MEDPDRRRALALTTSCTRRILAPDEVQDLRDYVIASELAQEGERGVALAMVQKIENGSVLSQPEAATIAKGFESRGEPWFHRFRAIPPDDGTIQGVRDPSRMRDATFTRDPSDCDCGRSECSECGCCAFLHEHDYAKNAFTPPKKDCGCSK